jgi:hypothetical protein
VREQVDRFVNTVTENPEPQSDGSSEAAASRDAPERGGAVGGQRLPLLVAHRPEPADICLHGGVGA